MGTAPRVLLLSLGTLLLVVAAVIVGTALGNGDVVWIGAVLVMSWAWGAFVFRGKWRALPVAMSTAVILAHLVGWKVYGKPMLDTTPVLDPAFVLQDIVPNNIVIAADGSHHPLRGFSVKRYLKALAEQDFRELTAYYRRRSIRFRPDPAMPSGYVAERRIEGWCGNTWHPQFFPRRVSAYHLEDLGESLHYILESDAAP